MLTAAYELLTALWPLLYQSVKDALDGGTCPRQAVKDAMDSFEAAAIVAEFQKYPRR